jgi:hypothetical protein
MTRAEALTALRAAAPELRARFGVTRLGLFGSIARDEARPDSDVDLVAEFDAGAKLSAFGLLELEARLSELLGRPTRIAALSRMNKVLRASVDRDLVYA